MKKVTKKTRLSNLKYEPVPNTLKGVAGEYRIEITQDNLTTIEAVENILSSGVPKVELVVKDDHIEVEGDFKSIHCSNVKVKSISGSSYFGTKTACKLHIQCSEWFFPCPDYKYGNIKRNLERAIETLLKIPQVEVASFNTGIVEYGEDDRQ